MASAAYELHPAPVPELDGVESFISYRWSRLGNRWIIDHIGHFTPDMNVEDIRNIIRTLVRRGRSSLNRFDMRGSNHGIVFEAQFPEWASGDRDAWDSPGSVAIANQLLAQGWEAINMLPQLWHVKTVWNVVVDPTIDVVMRDAYLEEATYVTRVACEGRLGLVTPSEYCARPAMHLAADRFRSLFPELGLQPGLPPPL